MIDHEISKPEAYGCAGAYGNKYRVRVPFASGEEIEKVLGYLLKSCRNDKVSFPGWRMKAMEITFFVYTHPEKEQGVDAADMIYEWDEREGLVKVK